MVHSILRSERGGFVPRTIVDESLVRLSELAIVVDAAYDATDMIALTKIARQYAVNIYDAAYLELALRLGLPLATRDVSLARAAGEAGIALFTA